MIISMTGFGRAEVKSENKEITVEVRSLNNRFLDITTRLPKNMFAYEDEIKTVVRKHILRGRVNIAVTIKELNGNTNSFKINNEVAENYLKTLKQLKKKLGLKGKIHLDHLLAFRDVILMDIEEEEVPDKTWNCVKNALDKALENLKQMRISEGKELCNDLLKRVKILDVKIVEIENIAKSRVEREYEKIKDRISTLGKVESVDEGRLESEIALIASRIDITEECIRFKSHDKLFLEAIKNEEAVGRKLNFLLQEMTREANTIGAKAYDADISHLVVDIKEEVEKIREQVQNIE